MENFQDYFNDDIYGNYLKGKSARELFTETVEDFFDDWDSNVYIAGQAGVGKTYIVELLAGQQPDTHFIQLEGQMSPFHFAVALAVEMYMAAMSGKKKICVYIDDINTLFSKVEMMDLFKEMLKPNGQGSFSYNKGLNLGKLEDLEREAIEYWKSLNPNRPGFHIPFNNQVRFIMTMNSTMPHTTEVADMKEGNTKTKMESLAAVRSRLGDGYYDLMMSKEQMFGWIAYVVWNDPTMCEGATWDQRYEMLQYLYDGWEKCNERSLRFVEFTMWKVMKKKPLRKDYVARWSRHFTAGV